VDTKIDLTPNRNAPSGTGSIVVPANRNTFPALIGTNSGMAVGVIKRK
jgi:hypothetical protein